MKIKNSDDPIQKNAKFNIFLLIKKFIDDEILNNPGVYSEEKIYDLYQQSIKNCYSYDFYNIRYIFLHEELSKMFIDHVVKRYFDNENGKIHNIGGIDNIIYDMIEFLETYKIPMSHTHPIVKFLSYLFEYIDPAKLIIICGAFNFSYNDGAERIINIVHQFFSYDLNQYIYTKYIAKKN